MRTEEAFTAPLFFRKFFNPYNELKTYISWRYKNEERKKEKPMAVVS